MPLPPPPPPGPPPAPGPPPPPPTFNQANTQPPRQARSDTVNRSALLGSIENFKASGLRKTKHLMVDKSAPAVGAAKTGGAGGTGAASTPKLGSATVGRSGTANRVQPPQGLGGLFAGGMPQLKPTGSRFSTETSNNNTGSPGAHHPGVGNRFGGNVNRQQTSASLDNNPMIKRHPSAGDIHNIAKNFHTNQAAPASSGGTRSQPSGGAMTAGGVKKWPPVSTGQAANGQLGNKFGGQQTDHSAMPPPPPPSTNRPSISQLSRNQPSPKLSANNVGVGGRQPGSGSVRDRPLPDIPGGVAQRRNGAGGGGPSSAPPPPPPARTEQTNLRRKSSVGGTPSNGLGSPRSGTPSAGNQCATSGVRTGAASRPLPPTPGQTHSAPSVRQLPPTPARNPPHSQSSPAPSRQPQVPGNFKPSRPTGGAPPPPPPSREPVSGPGGPPPPPPPPRGTSLSQPSAVANSADFELQFRFADISRLPPPEPFSNKVKTYPSKNPRNPAAQQANGNIRRHPTNY